MPKIPKTIAIVISNLSDSIKHYLKEKPSEMKLTYLELAMVKIDCDIKKQIKKIRDIHQKKFNHENPDRPINYKLD